VKRAFKHKPGVSGGKILLQCNSLYSFTILHYVDFSFVYLKLLISLFVVMIIVMVEQSSVNLEGAGEGFITMQHVVTCRILHDVYLILL